MIQLEFETATKFRKDLGSSFLLWEETGNTIGILLKRGEVVRVFLGKEREFRDILLALEILGYERGKP